MAVYYPNSNATFIHIPKTGGESLNRWSMENNMLFDTKQKHCTVSQARTIWTNIGLTFTFVRNPFDRMVSIFHFIGQEAKKRAAHHYDKLMENYYELGFENWLCEYSAEADTPYVRGFKNWKHSFDWYSSPKTYDYWIEDNVDIVIKLEQTDKDKVLSEILNTQVILPHENRSTRSNYKDYYNKHTRKIVETMFWNDLEKYGYEY